MTANLERSSSLPPRQPCVRGVTVQPIQFAGRVEGVRARARVRLTLGEVRDAILAQTPMFMPQDIIPVPCNPDALSMGYALKTTQGIVPLTRFVGTEVLLAGPRSTLVFEYDPVLKGEVFQAVRDQSQGPEGQSQLPALRLALLPAERQGSAGYPGTRTSFAS